MIACVPFDRPETLVREVNCIRPLQFRLKTFALGGTSHVSGKHATGQMDRMWSPWRSEYVTDAAKRSPSPGDSIFTTLLNENNDRENLILWRGELVFVIMNLYPYNNGHLLIVPYREVKSYRQLNEPEQAAIAATIDRCIGWLESGFSPEGFNVGMNLGPAAGAGIPEHLHVHVVPRWKGDTNFMSTTAETRVLPEDLSTTYEKLRAIIHAETATSDSN